MYADDTTLYCNINQDIGEEVINAQLWKLWEWLGANKLSLNIAKTKYMVFQTFTFTQAREIIIIVYSPISNV